jgi:hypothetical protein
MMFKDPLGMTAESLIGQAGGRDLSSGGATVYGPHANYVVASPRTSSDDVRALVELVRERVRQRLGVTLNSPRDVLVLRDPTVLTSLVEQVRRKIQRRHPRSGPSRADGHHTGARSHVQHSLLGITRRSALGQALAETDYTTTDTE